MSIPRLDCLPVELIHRICIYSDRPEIRSLRCTSRVISTVADEYFLDHITVFYERGDMEMAESIVKKPRIAKNIRTLRFQADRLMQLHHYKLWDALRKTLAKQMAILKGDLPSREEMAKSSKMSRAGRRQLLEAKRAVALQVNKHSKAELVAAYEYFAELLEDQNTLMEEHRGETCMMRLLGRCPKLDDVTVAMGNHEHSGIFHSWQKVEAFRKALVGPWRDDTSIRIGTRPLNEALVGAVESGRTMKALTVAPINHHFFDPDNEGLDLAHEVVSGLESINIQVDQDWHRSREDCAQFCRMERRAIQEGKLPPESRSERTCNCSDESDDEDERPETDEEAAARVMRSYEDNRVSHLLSKASNLRELTFRGPAPSDRHAPLQLSLILGDNHWTHLSKLDLMQFSAGEKELSDTLLSYASTLKHLGVRHACINGSWRGVLRKIGGRLPVLDSVRLRGYLVSNDQPFSLNYDPGDGPCEGYRQAEQAERFILTGEAEYFPSRW